MELFFIMGLSLVWALSALMVTFTVLCGLVCAWRWIRRRI